MISCANPKAQYLSYKDDIDTAILKVLDSGSYILGEQVSSFEKEFAGYLKTDFAIGCGSGTDALVLALKALDIGIGDEVIVPSHTAVPTVAAVVMAGATPVYVDVEPDFFTLDTVRVEEACTDKTKAIIAVHLYGQAAGMDELMAIARERDLLVVEDCAQATGATYQGKRVGSIGDVGCFSFFPTKNLGAIGDGGAVSCNDAGIAERLLGLRQYGWDSERICQEPGVNSRLDELQAAILRIQLRHLDADNARRCAIADRYTQGIGGAPVKLPAIRDGSDSVFHLYVIQSTERTALMNHLSQCNINTGIHYPLPVHLHPAFNVHYRPSQGLVNTDRLAKKVLSLPMYPELTQGEVEQVIAAVNSFRVVPHCLVK